MNLRASKASSYWLLQFKRKNRIVSRKITKVLSRRDIAQLHTVSIKIDDYRNTTKQLITKYNPENVFNTDQSGFNIENLSGRTLDVCGTKQILSSVNQANSLTHSYTIQPIISLNGKLVQEKHGQFGPQVQESLFTHPEVYVLPTSSGKVSKVILREWFSELYFPFAGNQALFH